MKTLRVLLDNGVFSHSELAEAVVNQNQVSGLVRKIPERDREYQTQKDALFTVGRLIREGLIEAYDYWEISCERFRGRIGIRACNALQGCEIHNCRAALDRSKFRKTIDLTDAFAKGGKKDVKAGVDLGQANQIAFFRWLCSLSQEQVEVLITHSSLIGLTPFEIDSLSGIDWFQFVCERSGSPENYPDVFHLWTAERNCLDAMLTLETGLPNLVARVRNEEAKNVQIMCEVFRPMDLLLRLGIKALDPLPMDAGRFYHWHEMG